MLAKDDVKVFNHFKKTLHLKKAVEDTLYSKLLSSYPISTIQTKASYNRALKIIESAMQYYEINKDTLSASNRQSFEQFILLYSTFIEEYETTEFALNIPKASPSAVLNFLMDEHGLKQTDLAEDLGGQPNVSNILAGKRELNRKQIEKLSNRFSVSPSVFFRASL